MYAPVCSLSKNGCPHVSFGCRKASAARISRKIKFRFTFREEVQMQIQDQISNRSPHPKESPCFDFHLFDLRAHDLLLLSDLSSLFPSMRTPSPRNNSTSSISYLPLQQRSFHRNSIFLGGPTVMPRATSRSIMKFSETRSGRPEDFVQLTVRCHVKLVWKAIWCTSHGKCSEYTLRANKEFQRGALLWNLLMYHVATPVYAGITCILQ